MKMPTGIRLTSEDLQLPLLDFFKRFCREFGWVPSTIEQYTRYIEIVDEKLDGAPFEESVAQEFCDCHGQRVRYGGR